MVLHKQQDLRCNIYHKMLVCCHLAQDTQTRAKFKNAQLLHPCIRHPCREVSAALNCKL